LSVIHPVDLHAHAIRALIDRVGIDPKLIDDVISGAVGQIGEQRLNTARSAVLAAGLPESVPAATIDRHCGSSQQAISFAAQGVIGGAYDVVIASGIESMSRVPIGSQVAGRDPFGAGVAVRYPDGLVPQGISAEPIAARWKLTREQLDSFAAESHWRAAAAWDDGRFDRELAPRVGGGHRGRRIAWSGLQLATLAAGTTRHTPTASQTAPEHVTACGLRSYATRISAYSPAASGTPAKAGRRPMPARSAPA